MTDSRPEISVRGNGAFVVLRFTFPEGCAKESWEIPFSYDEAFALARQIDGACQSKANLASCIQTAADAAYWLLANESLKTMCEEMKSRNPETWRDRGAML